MEQQEVFITDKIKAQTDRRDSLNGLTYRKENMNEQMKEKHVHIEILHHVSCLSIAWFVNRL